MIEYNEKLIKDGYELATNAFAPDSYDRDSPSIYEMIDMYREGDLYEILVGTAYDRNGVDISEFYKNKFNKEVVSIWRKPILDNMREHKLNQIL